MPPTTRIHIQKKQKNNNNKPYTKPTQHRKETHTKDQSTVNTRKEHQNQPGVAQGQMTMNDDDLDKVLKIVDKEIENDESPESSIRTDVPMREEDLNTVLEMMNEIECGGESQESTSKNKDDTAVRITSDSSPAQHQNKPFQLIGPSHVSQELLRMARSYWESMPPLTQTTLHRFKNTLFPDAKHTIL